MTSAAIVDSKWLRPKVLRLPDQQSEPITFQQIDIDHYEHLHLDTFMGPESSSIVPVIRMFGVNRDGNSILCHVHGFRPYFYIYTAKTPNPGKLQNFRKHLDSVCKNSDSYHIKQLPQMILNVEHVISRSIYGYSGQQRQNYLKISCALPEVVNIAARAFEKGQVESLGVYFDGQPNDRGHKLYETNLDYVIRFMVDNKVSGCSWVELPARKYKLREQKDFQSSCQIECDINYVDLISHSPEGNWAKVAPLRILSFDIETKVRARHFPQPEYESVIQIANVALEQGSKEPFINCIFTLNTCASIPGATIRSFDSEQQMLLAWAQSIVEIDPDIITGYNIHTFDIRYLLNRAKHLKIYEFPYLGRIPTIKTKIITESQLQQGIYPMNIEGRIQFDLIKVMRKDYKLNSYKLDSVSQYFLQDKKEGVHFTEITKLFNGNELTRRRLAIYCLKDALLPLRLNDKLMCLDRYIEMSMLTGAPMRYLLNGGSRMKILSLILRQAKQHNYILPTQALITGDNGNSMRKNKSGISTLENGNIESLSNIMNTYNLCYTTLLSQTTIERLRLRPEEYLKTPSGFCFIKPDNDHKTILPQILTNLIIASKPVKDELEKKTCERAGRISMNIEELATSFHNFISATLGVLPCIEVSESILGFRAELCEKMDKVTKRQKII